MKANRLRKALHMEREKDMRKLSFRGQWMLAALAVLALGAGAGITKLQAIVGGSEQNAKTPRDAQAISQAKNFSHAFRYAAEQAGPSVVKIKSHTAAKKVKATTRGGRSFNFNGQSPLGNGRNPFKGTPF